jgi:hypothetical protein
MTTREDIRGWLTHAKNIGATHLIVAVDCFDYEDYPVYVMPGSDPRKIVDEQYSGQNMQGCMEVYKLADDIEEQLAMKICKRF